jgi:hypothetical protein
MRLARSLKIITPVHFFGYLTVLGYMKISDIELHLTHSKMLFHIQYKCENRSLGITIF